MPKNGGTFSSIYLTSIYSDDFVCLRGPPFLLDQPVKPDLYLGNGSRHRTQACIAIQLHSVIYIATQELDTVSYLVS